MNEEPSDTPEGPAGGRPWVDGDRFKSSGDFRMIAETVPTFPGRDLGSLRTGVMAGSPCPAEVMNRVREQMGADEITIAYGLTEAHPAVTQTLTDDPVDVRVGPSAVRSRASR